MGFPQNVRWLRLFPGSGYAVSQILVLVVVVGIFFGRGVSTPLELYGLGWTLPFVFLLALLPSLMIGALAGVTQLMTGTASAVLARVGTTILLIALGGWISGLGSFASFSLYEDPVTLGEYVGIILGMEISLALSWSAALLTRRFLESRRNIRGEGR